VYVSHFIFYQPFHVASHFTYFVSYFMFRTTFDPMPAILVLHQPFHSLPAISMLCQHFLLCQSFYFSVRYYIYIYTIRHFYDIFCLLCVLQVYYLDNLLSNVPVLVGTLYCQFFTSDVIDRIFNLDRQMLRDGLVTFAKLPVSKICFVYELIYFYHFIIKTVLLSAIFYVLCHLFYCLFD
jgi:hypothetical protein